MAVLCLVWEVNMVTNLGLYTVELTVWLGRLANVISIKIRKSRYSVNYGTESGPAKELT